MSCYVCMGGNGPDICQECDELVTAVDERIEKEGLDVTQEQRAAMVEHRRDKIEKMRLDFPMTWGRR